MRVEIDTFCTNHLHNISIGNEDGVSEIILNFKLVLIEEKLFTSAKDSMILLIVIYMKSI